VGLPLEEEEIIARVVDALLDAYRDEVPLLPGAEAAVARLARSYPLGLASSSPHAVIAFVLERSGLDKYFTAWVSSDEVARGKPAPDVYLEACRRLGAQPERCVAVEDSRFGIRAAKAARLRVIAIPHPLLPLGEEVLDLVDGTLESIDHLFPEIARLSSGIPLRKERS
jgi:HAD superfamily hydrolase (TIGR01509 family)